jgi:glycosyltransferase involved in cell wall biosynthesis
MDKKLRLNFVWQGVTERWFHWNDGLRLAMRYLEEVYDVSYKEPWDKMDGDVILYWEAPCTVNGSNAPHYLNVRNSPQPKALLFAGGPVTQENTEGFDLFFLESQINEEEFTRYGRKWMTAFGVNDEVFKPIGIFPKTFDACMAATFAGWKRQPLFAEAVGEKGILLGRFQEHEPQPYTESSKSIRLPELPYLGVASVINACHTVVNTSEYWGGGQRCTLEAMACGVPVIVMSDSPKNCEYVEESGAGLIVDPNPESIRKAINEIKEWSNEEKMKGVAYIKSKWTGKHYADNLIKGIESIL